MAMFDNWNWDEIVPNIVKGAVTALPAIVANNYGANQVAGGNQQAANIALQNRNANVGTLNATNAEALRRADELRARMEAYKTEGAATGAPAVSYLRETMARDPYAMTPQQQQAIMDNTRIANAQLSNFGTAGSGRANTAIINDLQNRTRQDMVASNTAKASDAAGKLSQLGQSRESQAISGVTQAGTTGTQIAANLGPQIAGQNTQAATDVANAVTGTANSNAGSVGALGGYFARAANDAGAEGRVSRYGRFAAAG